MKMKGSMKYMLHFGFKQAGVLKNTFQPFPAGLVVWGACPPPQAPILPSSSLNTGPSTKMVIFKIDPRQIYNVMIFEPSPYL